MKLIRKFKRKSLYQKSLIIFTLIISIACISFLIYVFNSMVIYERNLVDNYIKYLADSGKLIESIDNNLFEYSSALTEVQWLRFISAVNLFLDFNFVELVVNELVFRMNETT